MATNLNVLMLLLAVSAQTSFAEGNFKSFRLKFNKNYENAEITLREQIYNSNLAKIEAHNKRYEKGLESYKMGVNQFSDMTDKEFASKFKTWQSDDSFIQGAKEQYVSKTNSSNVTSIDWRKKRIVTPVKNQGTCGGCWAFSATGALEGQFALKYPNNLTSFSEQQLLDCSMANKACDGGIVQYAINYVANNGITTESQYPYIAAKSTCKLNMKIAAGAEGYVNIKQNNEADLKSAVTNIGPVSVAVNATLLKHYNSGIFNVTCSDLVNHGVLVVGYNNTSSGAPYWIIKNSWGTEWGEKGYFRMAMGRGLCGIARQACYPVGVVDHLVLHGGANALWQNSLVLIIGMVAVAVRNLF